MATNEKERIFTGDTYAVAFECLEPQAEGVNTFEFGRAPITPTDTEVTLWDVQSQALVNIGPGGTDTDTATITDNQVSYLLDGSFTQTVGDYKMFVTAIFADGQRVTEKYQFKVQART
jgi:hypothetical protein